MNAMMSGAGSDGGEDHGNDLHDGAPGADWHDLGPRDACFGDSLCLQATVNGVKVGLFLVDDEVCHRRSVYARSRHVDRRRTGRL